MIATYLQTIGIKLDNVSRALNDLTEQQRVANDLRIMKLLGKQPSDQYLKDFTKKK